MIKQFVCRHNLNIIYSHDCKVHPPPEIKDVGPTFCWRYRFMDIAKNIATIIREFGFYKCNTNSCKMNYDFIRMSKNKIMPFQRLEELDEIERWRKMARIDAIFFYAYPTVLALCSYFVCPANNDIDILLVILFYAFIQQ